MCSCLLRLISLCPALRQTRELMVGHYTSNADVEPKHMPDQEIYRLLDLAATEEDQHEVGALLPFHPLFASLTSKPSLVSGNEQITNLPRDFTMKPGGQRSSLPLMRRFNEHSERLLSQALSVAPVFPAPLSETSSEVEELAAHECARQLTTVYCLASQRLGSRSKPRFPRPRSRRREPFPALPSSLFPLTHSLARARQDRRYYSEIELADLASASSASSRITLALPSASGAGAAPTTGSAAGEEGEGGGGELDGMFEKRERVRGVVEGVRDEWDGRLAEVRVVFSRSRSR